MDCSRFHTNVNSFVPTSNMQVIALCIIVLHPKPWPDITLYTSPLNKLNKATLKKWFKSYIFIRKFHGLELG